MVDECITLFSKNCSVYIIPTITAKTYFFFFSLILHLCLYFLPSEAAKDARGRKSGRHVFGQKADAIVRYRPYTITEDR